MGLTRQQQKERRSKQQEKVYIFDGQFNLLGEAERENWEFEIEMNGGNVVKAAHSLGLKEIPLNAKALWGKSSQHALDQYRQWQNKKSKKA